MVLCNIGIGLPPFLRVSHISNDNLSPLFAIVISIDLASIIFGLNGEYAIF